jgi:hypothetical protein
VEKIQLIFLSLFLISIGPKSICQTTVGGKLVKLNGDTMSCTLHQSSKKKEARTAIYHELQIVDSIGNVRTLYPDQILGFVVNTTAYKSLNSKEFKIFMRLVVDGHLQLFHYSGAVMPGGDKYIFKKAGENEFTLMNASMELTKLTGFNNGLSGSRASGADIPLIEREKRFLNFFGEYLKDCPVVVKKIRTGFYTSQDVEAIFRDYNTSCAR